MGVRDLEFGFPRDDLSRSFLATLSAGTQATGYEPSKLMNDDPAYPFKVTSTTFRLVWDFSTAIPVLYVLLVHHNFLPGTAVVKFEMNATDSWGSPSFTRTFELRTYHEDDFPVNEHLDLRDVSPSYRYASLVVSTPNSVSCSLGKFPMLTTVRSLDGTLELEGAPEDDESHPLVEHRTDAGVVTINSHGTRQRWIRGDKLQVAEDSRTIRAWNRATHGRALPFVLIPHLEDDSLAVTIPPTVTEESMLVRWEDSSLPRTYVGPDLLSRWRLKFEEVSRGLKPTPSAV